MNIDQSIIVISCLGFAFAFFVSGYAYGMTKETKRTQKWFMEASNHGLDIADKLAEANATIAKLREEAENAYEEGFKAGHAEGLE